MRRTTFSLPSFATHHHGTAGGWLLLLLVGSFTLLVHSEEVGVAMVHHAEESVGRDDEESVATVVDFDQDQHIAHLQELYQDRNPGDAHSHYHLLSLQGTLKDSEQVLDDQQRTSYSSLTTSMRQRQLRHHPRRSLEKRRSNEGSLQPIIAIGDFLISTFGINKNKSSDRGCPAPETQPPLPGKKGICLTMRDGEGEGTASFNIPKLARIKARWNYSWSSKIPEGQPKDVEFVPMIWGAWGTDGLKNTLAKVSADYDAGLVKRLLGFNEPDHKPQANMAVDKAVEFWPYLEGTGIPLVSPAAAHAKREWMTTFMRHAEDDCLRMEWIGVHWYGGPNADSFKNFVTDVYKMYGSKRKLLITEFAPADWTTGGDKSRNRWSKQKVLDFAKEALPWLEQQDFVAGYAWFSFGQNHPNGHSSALFNANGHLTKLGQYYASVTPDNIYGDQSIAFEE